MVRILAKKIEQRSIASLVPYAANSRTHSDAQVAQLAASFREFGFTNPVLIDERGGLIAGHGRIMAAKAVGLDEVPCIVLAGLSDVQRRAYVIADNKLALNAEWDEEMLRQELADLREEDFDFELTGFTLDELVSLKSDTENIDVAKGDGASGGEASYLVIGEFKIPLDEDEYNGVRAAISAYAEEAGTIFGFGSHLIRKLRTR